MAGNKRGEGDSTLSNLADLSVHRHQFCVPSTRAQGRAAQNAPISIAHCWWRGVGPPRFSFLATARFDPLTNGRIRFLSSPFEFSHRGRNSRDSFLFFSLLFSESFEERGIGTTRVEDRVPEGKGRNEKRKGGEIENAGRNGIQGGDDRGKTSDSRS